MRREKPKIRSQTQIKISALATTMEGQPLDGARKPISFFRTRMQGRVPPALNNPANTTATRRSAMHQTAARIQSTPAARASARISTTATSSRRCRRPATRRSASSWRGRGMCCSPPGAWAARWGSRRRASRCCCPAPPATLRAFTASTPLCCATLSTR